MHKISQLSFQLRESIFNEKILILNTRRFLNWRSIYYILFSFIASYFRLWTIFNQTKLSLSLSFFFTLIHIVSIFIAVNKQITNNKCLTVG